jgi:hypothetical protein
MGKLCYQKNYFINSLTVLTDIRVKLFVVIKINYALGQIPQILESIYILAGQEDLHSRLHMNCRNDGYVKHVEITKEFHVTSDDATVCRNIYIEFYIKKLYLNL